MAYEILSPHVAEIVVTGSRRNMGSKSDEIDAFALAESMRVGAIQTRVAKNRGRFGALRELARVYAKVRGDHVRTQNRLRALFRSRAIASDGVTTAHAQEAKAWIDKLPVRMRAAAQTQFDEMIMLGELRDRAEREMLAEAKKHRMWRILQTCPGLGPIRVAQLLSIVVDPHRFRTSRPFWKYCGLAVVTVSSSDWEKSPRAEWKRRKPMTWGLNPQHNHVLKEIFAGAAMTVIANLPNEPLHEDYQRGILNGTEPSLMRLTLARKIATIALAMWKHEEEYDPAKARSRK